MIPVEDFGRLLGERLEPLIGDADGQRAHEDVAEAVLDQHLVAVGAAAQHALAVLDEVQAIILDVEPHQVAGCDISLV